ncbi:hypothetical protein BpHYR1_038524 [Brachionus plicatilis]|uniref:Uncharacterized protein n=1 Tax=Brachionus plicatilis TaxID=10195 RepID=A0A3M7Q0X6_BRAPC|nr:hypothetical protein BpHYR1_038524 [Brachionus plicatilis]
MLLVIQIPSIPFRMIYLNFFPYYKRHSPILFNIFNYFLISMKKKTEFIDFSFKTIKTTHPMFALIKLLKLHRNAIEDFPDPVDPKKITTFRMHFIKLRIELFQEAYQSNIKTHF